MLVYTSAIHTEIFHRARIHLAAPWPSSRLRHPRSAAPVRAPLAARDVRLGVAGWVVSLAIWLTMISVPVGGFVSDKLGRPSLVIIAGSLVAAGATLLLPVWSHAVLAFAVVGLAVGPPPGPLMALIPRAMPPERVTSTF